MDDEFGDDIDWSAVPNVGGSSTAAAMSTNNNNYNNSMTNRGGALHHQQMGATTNANTYNNTNTYNTNSAYPQQQNIGNMGFDYAEGSQPSLTSHNNNFVAPQPAQTNYTNTNNYSSTDTNVLQKQVSIYCILCLYFNL